VDFDIPPTRPIPGMHFRGTVVRRWISSHALDPDAIPLPHGVKPWLHKALGLPFRYLVHRVMAEVPFPDGRTRKAVFILRAYGDPALPRWFGRTIGGAPFEPARIQWHPEGHVAVRQAGKTVYEATFTPGWKGRLPLQDADEAILGMSFGSRRDDGWRFFPETHDPWTPEPWTSHTKTHALLEGLGIQSQADHCIGMADVPHYFARAIRVPAASAPRPTA
jgi:hypothetical protein